MLRATSTAHARACTSRIASKTEQSATRGSSLRDECRPRVRDRTKEAMRRRMLIEGAVLGTLAMLLPLGGAFAQPIRGAMAAQSRADVRISVSTMPRFHLKTAAPAGSVKNHGSAPALAFSTNAAGLRYALITGPARERAGVPSGTQLASRGAGDTLLVIVAPD